MELGKIICNDHGKSDAVNLRIGAVQLPPVGQFVQLQNLLEFDFFTVRWLVTQNKQMMRQSKIECCD